MSSIYPFEIELTIWDSDLDLMREQQTAAQTDVQQLSSQSQAMLSLNMKLQNTVMKTQVKTLDLELRRLDAQQAVERLNITKASRC